MRKLQWKHPLQLNFNYEGFYERDKAGERMFVLIAANRKADKRIPYNSWQAAKSAGWRSKR